MRVIFMGTPDFAVPSLKALNQAFGVSLVLTRPDAIRGRGNKAVASPVKAAALELGLDVLETKKITPEVLDRLRELKPDIICVAAFGCILPDALLELAPCVNVHGSLLPRWRGAAPIQRAILAGDERAGISIMQVVHELDAGAYCAQASVEVAHKSCTELMSELAELGAQELVRAVPSIVDGSVEWVSQDESQVSYAHKIEKNELALDPAQSALVNRRRVQTSSDAAPSRCLIANKGVRVLEAHELSARGLAAQELEARELSARELAAHNLSAPEYAAGEHGTVAAGEHGTVAAGESPLAQAATQLAPKGVYVHKGQVLLGCADGALQLLRVKPDGKREMDARSWAAGLRDVNSWSMA